MKHSALLTGWMALLMGHAALAADSGSDERPFPYNLSGTDARPPTRSEFLERSSIFYNVPGVGPGGLHGNMPLFFEAQIAPHLYLWNGLFRLENPGDAVDTLVRGDGCAQDPDKESCIAHSWHWVNAFSVTPQVRLRMVFNSDTTDNHSSPVRPPSFMPRFDYQAFFYKRPLKGPTWAESWGSAAAGVWLVSPSVAIGHHSNGQEHCRFDPTGRTKDPNECAPWDGDLGKVNFRSGDFSTNYLIERLHVAWIDLDDYDFERRRYVAGLILEQNPRNFLGGSGLNDQEYALYGPWRLGLHLEWSSNEGWDARGMSSTGAGQWTVSGEAHKYLGVGNGVAGYRTSVEVRRTFDRLFGLGLFARFFSGQDYLNLLFVRTIPWTIQFGLVFDSNQRLRQSF